MRGSFFVRNHYAWVDFFFLPSPPYSRTSANEVEHFFFFFFTSTRQIPRSRTFFREPRDGSVHDRGDFIFEQEWVFSRCLEIFRRRACMLGIDIFDPDKPKVPSYLSCLRQARARDLQRQAP